MTQTKIESRITEMIKELEMKESQFYQRTIELHNNPSLRSIAKRFGSLPIVRGSTDHCETLSYTGNGFVRTRLSYDPGYAGNGCSSLDLQYIIRDGVLLNESLSGYRVAMLETFPSLTIESLESAIEKELRKHGVA